jgi:hypothetical protein
MNKAGMNSEAMFEWLRGGATLSPGAICGLSSRD